VRTFGKANHTLEGPGLHFAIPIVQQVDVVNVEKIRRAEIGFRTTKAGPKRDPAEAEMLTGDENIVDAQMIVQYQVSDPLKYLFKLNDPDTTLHVAAQVALRGVVGQMTITSSFEDLNAAAKSKERKVLGPAASASASAAAAASGAPSAAAADAGAPPSGSASARPPKAPPALDDSTDILTKGRERAQIATKVMLQKLMDLYQSGVRITEVKLLPVDVPHEVQDAFHDVVRAREEREKKINKARGYREDRIPRARGEAQKIVRAAEAYRRERVLRAEGETTRFKAVLAEYRKARAVTRERIHLETLERILAKVGKKVFIDKDVAKGMLPVLPLGGGNLLGPAAPAAAPAAGGQK